MRVVLNESSMTGGAIWFVCGWYHQQVAKKESEASYRSFRLA